MEKKYAEYAVEQTVALLGVDGGSYCTTGQHLCQTPFLFSFLPKPRFRAKGSSWERALAGWQRVTLRAAGGWDLPRQRAEAPPPQRGEGDKRRAAPVPQRALRIQASFPKRPAQAAGPA